jgi:hypothetical protein
MSMRSQRWMRLAFDQNHFLYRFGESRILRKSLAEEFESWDRDPAMMNFSALKLHPGGVKSSIEIRKACWIQPKSESSPDRNKQYRLITIQMRMIGFGTNNSVWHRNWIK